MSLKQWLAVVAAASLLTLATPTRSATVTYAVSVDTRAIAGTTGSGDFNFNPGVLSSQAASVAVLSFTGAAVAGGPAPLGNVSGTLPGIISFNNATPFNDYFQGLTFGSSLEFSLKFAGEALTAPDGSSSGSTFAFSLFADAAGTVPVLTSNTMDGFALTVDVNTDGTTTLNNYSSSLTIAPVGQAPEPASYLLMLVGGTAMFIGIGRQRRVRR